MNRIAKILVIAVLLSPVPGFLARAAEVTLVSTNQVVNLGDTFSLSITISLDEDAGEQLAGGVIDLGYDDSVVEILDVAIDPYWDFLPDSGSKAAAGQREGIGFDAFENNPVTGNAVIASITLEARAAGTSQLSVLPSSQFFSATAEFFPTVTGASIRVNAPPVADDQIVGTDEDTAAPVTLTGSDPDSDDLTYAVVASPAHGTLSGTAPSLTYTPAANFNGSDSFTFQINDGNADSNIATVSITVNPLEDIPVVDDRSVTISEDTSAAITLTGSDADGDSMTFSVVTDPANGSLSGTTPDLTYTPAADFNGTDSFTYQASDGKAESNIATVSITVNAVNDAPLADNQALTTDEDTATTVTLTGSDVDSDPLTFSVVTDPAHGTLSGTASNLTYTPDTDFNGTDSFSFQANDGKADSNIAMVSITVNAANDAPLADAGLDETIVWGATVELDGSNSGDVEGDVLTFMWTLVSIPAASTAVLSDPGAVNPSIIADLVGNYVVQLIVNDGLANSAPATVTITADVDTDSDGVPQSIDNCTAVANADQLDTDNDGYGNLCDGDLNNDGSTDTLDLQLYKGMHRTEQGDLNYDPAADFNGDAAIDTLDLNIYKELQLRPPGPSCCGD